MFRDNPSEAEKEQVLTAKQKRKYKIFLLSGALGILFNLSILLLIFCEVLPSSGKITVLCLLETLVTFPVFCFFLITGVSKGRDRRPGVMETFGAGGRR